MINSTIASNRNDQCGRALRSAARDKRTDSYQSHPDRRAARRLHRGAASTPMPAVSAMAKAPRKVTRSVARRMLAPMAPSRARKSRDATEHPHRRHGDRRNQHHEQRHRRAQAEGRRRGQRRLDRARRGHFGDAEFIMGVRGQCILGHELIGELAGPDPSPARA